jgi:hypothetical protein
MSFRDLGLSRAVEASLLQRQVALHLQHQPLAAAAAVVVVVVVVVALAQRHQARLPAEHLSMVSKCRRYFGHVI